MHFWIDKRATTFQYGRRRPNFYSSGTFSSSAFGRERDKTFRVQDTPYRPPSSAHLPGPSSALYGHGTTTMSPPMPDSPAHRFQIPISAAGREQPALTTTRISGTGDMVSPYSTRRTRSAGSAGNIYVTRPRSRSQSRERRAGGVPRSERRRRSSSGARRSGGSNGVTSSDVAVRAALTELQQLRTDSSFSSSEAVDTTKWSKTKRIGLTLCFMGVMLLCTVAAKFLIEGPSVIDTSRRGPTHETAVYFFFTELVFLAFAMALFFTGVACLRKRTNAYLLRQFNQHILHSARPSSHNTPGHPDDLFLDPVEDEESLGAGVTESPFRNLHRHPEGISPISTPTHSCVFHSALVSSNSGRRGHHLISLPIEGRPPRRCPHFHNSAASMLQKQQPPPYNVALYLPLPNHDQIPESGTESGQDWSLVTSSTSEVIVKDDETEKEMQENDLVAIAVAQSLNQDPETPPPTYEQFTFQI